MQIIPTIIDETKNTRQRRGGRWIKLFLTLMSIVVFVLFVWGQYQNERRKALIHRLQEAGVTLVSTTSYPFSLPSLLRPYCPDLFRNRKIIAFHGNKSKITDQSLNEIDLLSNLEFLSLNQCNISDVSLSKIKRLTKLVHLELQGTHITDAGLKQLHELNRLEYLSTNQTSVTSSALQPFWEQMSVARANKQRSLKSGECQNLLVYYPIKIH